MFSSPFPTLDVLRTQNPNVAVREEMSEWVGQLNARKAAEAPRAAGWTPAALIIETAESLVEPTVDVEAIKAAAREEGFRKGYAAGKVAGIERGAAEGRRSGREEGRQEVFEAESAFLRDFRVALEGVVAGVGPAVERWREAVEERAADLAIEAVRSLLAAELSIQRPDAMGIVREAIGHAEGAVRATVRLSPFDRAALAERKEEIIQACAGLRDLELVDDRAIEGGCIIETENGVIDATLETRLGLLEAA